MTSRDVALAFAFALGVRLCAHVLALLATTSGWRYDTSVALDARVRSRANANERMIERGVSHDIGTRATSCEAHVWMNAWDGVHFLALSANGGAYAFEHAHAFFPGLAYGIRSSSVIARALMRLVRVNDDVDEMCAHAMAACAFSTVAFATARVALESSAKRVMKDGTIAKAAGMLFALNPANVFYGIAYTESAFSAASFAGFVALADGWTTASGVAFGVASAFRSNGILHAIPVVAVAGARAIDKVRQGKTRDAVLEVARGGIACGMIFTPYVAFSAYGDALYCRNPAFAANPRPWCVNSISNAYGLLPKTMYGFLQRHYWGLGFLSSYTTRNAGNVALGAPAMFIGAMCTWRYFMPQIHTLGRKPADERAGAYARHQKPLPTRALEFAAYAELAVGVFVAATYAHAQVATRFLSTFPAMYWSLAEIGARNSRARNAITAYYLAYAMLGVLLVPSFYPWT